MLLFDAITISSTTTDLQRTFTQLAMWLMVLRISVLRIRLARFLQLIRRGRYLLQILLRRSLLHLQRKVLLVLLTKIVVILMKRKSTLMTKLILLLTMALIMGSNHAWLFDA
ncbi:hypothetical protein EJ08DRAFT_356084 [Tothia fuscella]|uniref:Uncharacterized protein n=1 Tax=Tothia fuscella TaxID=1048955 RepID=A0A9P4TWD1_9PEZI|nr:hypothetical protein EJ08DRAFT_356084 [Tothia fuscella]